MTHPAQKLLVAGTLLLASAALLPAVAQCPPKTQITDVLLNADGTPASGRVVISWPTFQIGPCQVIAGQTTITVTEGNFRVELFPNDQAVPEGTSYRVAYYLRSGRITTEYWVVPSSGSPVPLAAVRSSSVPSPAVMLSMAQVTNLLPALSRKLELPDPCPAGKFLQANGSAEPPQVSCVDSTGAPLASSTVSGTVKTDVDATDPVVYTKPSTDALLAAKADAVHTHSATDITAGTLDPARLPAPTAASLGGVLSGSCSGTDKVTGISTAGTILCGADQGGGSGSQHQVDGLNLLANDPVNFQDSTTIDFSNPSAGSIQAQVKDGAITGAKLAVQNPTGTQLAGIGDANIPAGALSPDRIAGIALIANDASATPGASKLVRADASGKIVDGWLSANVSLLGASIDLTTETAGTLPVAKGGTGATSFSANGVLLGNGTSPVAVTAAGTAGQVLRVPPAGGAPAFGPLDLSSPAAVSGVLPEANLDAAIARIADIHLGNLGGGIAGANTYDFSGAAATLPVKAGTIPPGSCVASKELFLDTDAVPGQQLFVCNASGNGWILVGDGGGSGADSTKTHTLEMTCDTPRTSSLAGNAFWTVAGLAEWDWGHWEFVKDVDGKIYCHLTIPETLAVTPNAAVILRTAANATTGVTRLSIRSFVFGDGDALNPAAASWTPAAAQDVTVPPAARTLKDVIFTTLPSLAARKILVVEVFHEGTHANDTLAVNTELFKVLLRVDLTQ